MATLSWGCADLIGLNGLGDDGAGSGGSAVGGGAGGGSSADDNTGGDSGVGGGSAAGGTSAGGSGEAGGATGDGGSDGTGGASDSGGTDSGGADGTGGTSTGGGSGLAYVCTDDEFLDAGVTADCWAVFNTDALTGGGARGYSWDEGEISLQPKPERGWRDGDAGYFMYQELRGNFVFEVHGNIEDLNGDLPTVPDVYGGLLLMPSSVDLDTTPRSNYYAVKFGILANGESGYLGEYASDALGTTIATPGDEQAITASGVYLRVCRVDDYLWVGAKLGGVAPWTPLHANDAAFYDTTASNLTPLGEFVRVGLLGEMLSDGASGSVRITYDNTEFRTESPYPPPTDVDDCDKVHFEDD